MQRATRTQGANGSNVITLEELRNISDTVTLELRRPPQQPPQTAYRSTYLGLSPEPSEVERARIEATQAREHARRLEQETKYQRGRNERTYERLEELSRRGLHLTEQQNRMVEYNTQKQRELRERHEREQQLYVQRGQNARVAYQRAMDYVRGFFTPSQSIASTSNSEPLPTQQEILQNTRPQDVVVESIVHANVSLFEDALSRARNEADMNNVVSQMNDNYRGLLEMQDSLRLTQSDFTRAISSTNARIQHILNGMTDVSRMIMANEAQLRVLELHGNELNRSLQQVISIQSRHGQELADLRMAQQNQGSQIQKLDRRIGDLDEDVGMALEDQDGRIQDIATIARRAREDFVISTETLREANERDNRTSAMMAKMRDNLDDHGERITALEGGSTARVNRDLQHIANKLKTNVEDELFWHKRGVNEILENRTEEIDKKLKDTTQEVGKKLEDTTQEVDRKLRETTDDVSTSMQRIAGGVQKEQMRQRLMLRTRQNDLTIRQNRFMRQVGEALAKSNQAAVQNQDATRQVQEAVIRIGDALVQTDARSVRNQATINQMSAALIQTTQATIQNSNATRQTQDAISQLAQSFHESRQQPVVPPAVRSNHDPDPDGSDDGNSDNDNSVRDNDDSVRDNDSSVYQTAPPSPSPPSPPSVGPALPSPRPSKRSVVMNRDRGHHQDIFINLTLQQMGPRPESRRPPIPDISGHGKRGKKIKLKRYGKKIKLSA